MKMNGYQNKIAVVTGGGSGIGEEIARVMAENGAHTVIFDTNIEKAQEVSSSLEEKYKTHSFPLLGDVSLEQDVIRLVQTTINQFGRIDILVNNAGITDSPKPTIDQDLDDWQRVIDVNLRGSNICSKLIGEQMVRQNYGKILMISSVAGIVGLSRKNSYSSAKAGMIVLTKNLASEWGPHHINVNAIAPGFIKTPILKKGIENKSFNEDYILKMIPLGILGEPKDIAYAALFLCSDRAKFISGITLIIDGGLLAGFGMRG